jgi:hypothetical protein
MKYSFFIEWTSDESFLFTVGSIRNVLLGVKNIFLQNIFLQDVGGVTNERADSGYFENVK